MRQRMGHFTYLVLLFHDALVFSRKVRRCKLLLANLLVLLHVLLALPFARPILATASGSSGHFGAVKNFTDACSLRRIYLVTKLGEFDLVATAFISLQVFVAA